MQLERVRQEAAIEQERAAAEAELAQMVEIQKKLEEKLLRADEEKLLEQERIRAQVGRILPPLPYLYTAHASSARSRRSSCLIPPR